MLDGGKQSLGHTNWLQSLKETNSLKTQVNFTCILRILFINLCQLSLVDSKGVYRRPRNESFKREHCFVSNHKPAAHQIWKLLWYSTELPVKTKFCVMICNRTGILLIKTQNCIQVKNWMAASSKTEDEQILWVHLDTSIIVQLELLKGCKFRRQMQGITCITLCFSCWTNWQLAELPAIYDEEEIPWWLCALVFLFGITSGMRNTGFNLNQKIIHKDTHLAPGMDDDTVLKCGTELYCC